MPQSKASLPIDTDSATPETIVSEPVISFAQSEMNRMKYDPIKMRVNINVDPEGGGKTLQSPLFHPDPNGNLMIFFPNLAGYLRTVKDGRDYRQKYVTKVKNATEDKEWNYGQNMEGLDIFIHPYITLLFKAKRYIKHLIICDDPVTAYILCENDIPALAIPGMPYLKDQALPNQIYDIIIDICTVCEVKKLTYLVPDTVLDLKYDETIDLAIKPTRIFNSLWNLYIKVCYGLNIHLYFAYTCKTHGARRLCEYFCRTIDPNDPGILDYEAILEDIKKELYTDGIAKGYVIVHDLKGAKMSEVKKIFGIDGGGATFYETYSTIIQNEQFIYNRTIFQFNHDEFKATKVKSLESNQFICVKGVFYMKGVKTDLYGSKLSTLERFPDDSFKKKFTRFSKDEIISLKADIPYYEDMEARPNHINYQQDWEDYDEDSGFTYKYYNVYSKILHKPKQGTYDLSLKFIKHIFGEHEVIHKGVTYLGWQLGLDYIKLLFCKPTQPLPVLCLASEKRVTGKTTFWNWMKEIFSANAVHLTANDINSQFTTLFAGKLLAVFEEAFIDKLSTIERIKDIVTAKKIKLEKKSVDAIEITNFLKVGMATNKINNFAPIDREEVRFWIRDIPSIPGGENVRFVDELYREIPAFLHYIIDKDYYTNNETRSWFANELIHTEALENLKSKTRTQYEIIVERAIKDYMIMFRRTWCKLSAKDILNLSDEKTLTLANINLVLETKWSKARSNRMNRYTYYSAGAAPLTAEYDIVIFEEIRDKAHYTFTLSDFERPDDIITYHNVYDDILEMEKHETIKTAYPFWKNVLWKEFITIKKIATIPIDQADLKKMFDDSKSFAEFDEQCVKVVDKVPF
ncbi:MAG: hypothetical protein IT265_07090 [Saprospiraceae bacterium]|nr:hypothetical protein [Saprospiraceae bacterium]